MTTPTHDKNFAGDEALVFIRFEKLIALAEDIVSNSLHPDAQTFDTAKWLRQWLEQPQLALGGIKPSALLDTDAGVQRVMQVLAALESGSLQ